jgi:hypothetical protein
MNATNNCLACSTITPLCKHCNRDTTCISCQSYAYLDAASKCINCRLGNPNCKYCTNTTICQTCIDGFYLNASNTICSDCNEIFDLCANCTSTNCS